jgi:hypothetical protein
LWGEKGAEIGVFFAKMGGVGAVFEVIMWGGWVFGLKMGVGEGDKCG